MKKILVIDPIYAYRDDLSKIASDLYADVKWVKKGKQGLDLLENLSFDIVLVELGLSDIDGRDLITKIQEMNKNCSIIVFSDMKHIIEIKDSLRFGVSDFLIKPLSIPSLKDCIEKTLLEREKNKEDTRCIFKSCVMKKILAEVKMIAACNANVFIHGESGCGKEEIARIIHENSPRKDSPFIKVNCSAIPETLVESEFFGHEKGAFTGAIAKRLGRFELANNGSLLLDEISEVPYNLQAKLLRIIQEQEFERVGSMESQKVDVRLISTSNRNMLESIENKYFREDLYYRLNVIPVHIPPLRERPVDILPLAEKFIKKASLENNLSEKFLASDAKDKLLSYHFPGNIRELINICQRASILSPKAKIEAKDIFLAPKSPSAKEGISKKTLAQIEAKAILKTLQECANNKTKAAKILDITVKTLRSKLDKSSYQ